MASPSIVERDAGPHQETVSESIRRYPHSARSEAVQRVGFILGARHQAREGELHAERGARCFALPLQLPKQGADARLSDCAAWLQVLPRMQTEPVIVIMAISRQARQVQ